MLPDSATPCWNFNEFLYGVQLSPRGRLVTPPALIYDLSVHQALSSLILLESLMHWLVPHGQ